jgi:ADP-ribose pyrophosphatase YjhB (NUDIX family)
MYRNPIPTVDIIIEVDNSIVLIERGTEPFGWALPGGFVDYGERLERAAVREAREETRLDVDLKNLLYVYSDPERDPRKHTISTVFVAEAQGKPVGADDADEAHLVSIDSLPDELCFDHREILDDYLEWRQDARAPRPDRKS